MMTKREFLRRGAGLAVGSAVGGRFGLAPLSAQNGATASGAKENAIARVTVTPVNVAGEYVAGSFKRPTRLGGVVCEVETADGLTGHGFSWTNGIAAGIVRDVIAPYLKGKDAMAREAISEGLYARLTGRGETGHVIYAVSLVDLALWDIAGKRYKEPVWRLLGGARNEVKIYCTCGSTFLNREELGEVGRQVAKSGISRVKMVVANLTPGKSVDEVLAEDAARVRIMKEAVGANGFVSVDANERLDGAQARHLARLLARYDLGWFEEPVRDNDPLRLADFRREVPMPVAAGHYDTSLAKFRDFAMNNSVDILLMNVCSGGGFTAGVKVAALAEAFGMPLHNGGGYANYNMHLHAGVASGGMCEWHLESVALVNALYKGVPELMGDRLVLPTTPGLGFELNRDALKEFAAKSA